MSAEACSQQLMPTCHACTASDSARLCQRRTMTATTARVSAPARVVSSHDEKLARSCGLTQAATAADRSALLLLPCSRWPYHECSAHSDPLFISHSPPPLNQDARKQPRFTGLLPQKREASSQ